MRILNDGTKITIDRDENVLKLIEGQSLADVSLGDMRITADNLAKLYMDAATAHGKPENGVWVPDLTAIKKYALMKQKYLQTYSK